MCCLLTRENRKQISRKRMHVDGKGKERHPSFSVWRMQREWLRAGVFFVLFEPKKKRKRVLGKGSKTCYGYTVLTAVKNL